MIGVSEAALRKWTDDGKISAFITPGGHRRYSKVELKEFIDSRPKILDIKELATEIEETAPLHREISSKALKDTIWYASLNNQSRENVINICRHLFHLIIKSITAPSERDETIQMAKNTGNEFGETLAKLGLPLTDSVEVFTSHRQPIINAVTLSMKKKRNFSESVVEVIPLLDHVMDEALVALVAAHQRFGNQIHYQAERRITR